MRILVALDLEDGTALQVVQQACRLATAFGGTGTVFDLVYVDSTHSPATFVAEPEQRDEMLGGWDRFRVRFQNKLEMMLFRVPREMRGRARIEVGDPALALIRLAPEYDAVVVGTRVRPMLSRLMNSSVADRVTRSSPVPVLVVRPDAASVVTPLPVDRPAPVEERAAVGQDAPANVLSFRPRLDRSNS